MSREPLGNFELMVLLALLRVGEDAYGVRIAEAIEGATKKDVMLASVYAALERLQNKGFVSSELGEPTAERGGRAKKYFHITAQGLRQVRETKAVLVKLWREVPELSGGGA